MTKENFFHDLAAKLDIYVIDIQRFINNVQFEEYKCPKFMWEEEADFVLFKDNQTDFLCYIRRNYNMGFYTGYVIFNTDSDYEDSMSDKPWRDLEVHGGVTLVDKNQNNNKSYMYKIGFDCAHGFDNMPFIDPYNEKTYKTMDFCIKQCKLLAKQLFWLNRDKK
jgi:hypothetical protein